MLKHKYLIIFLISLFIFSCKFRSETSNIFPADSKVPADLEIKLERTSCYGTCPVYELTVKADGSVRFKGIQDTKEKNGETKIDEEKLGQLIAEFKKANYFDLNDSYTMENCPSAATDNPTAITSIQINGKKKTISHYIGCYERGEKGERFPAELLRLENKIDEIVETKRWVGESK